MIAVAVTEFNSGSSRGPKVIPVLLFLPKLIVNTFFLEHPEPTMISAGENASLSCSAAGFPVPDITWTKDGGVVNESVGIEIATLSNDTQTRSVLAITSATVNLTGVYRCVSITTIEGFPLESVESNTASLIVQGKVMHRMHYCVCTSALCC